MLVAYYWNECLKLICSSAMSYLYHIHANLIKLHVPTFRQSERSRQRFCWFWNPNKYNFFFQCFRLSSLNWQASRDASWLIGWWRSLGCQRPGFSLWADDLLKMPDMMRPSLNITNITSQTIFLCLLISRQCKASFLLQLLITSLWVLELCPCPWRFFSSCQQQM